MNYWHRLRNRLAPGMDATRLSAFIDGELSDDAREEMAAQIALEPATRRRLDEMRALDRMVAAALQPSFVPDADHCADLALGQVGRLSSTPRPAATSPRVPKAVLASVGLLVTAGVAFVGLRRRGLV